MAQPQVWLITGASRGLGYDMSKFALAAGHKVLAVYRSKPSDTTKWDELEKLGGIWTQLNVSADDTEEKVKALVAQHGKIDVLINNAGYALSSSIEDVPMDEVQNIFNANLFGTIRTIKGVLPSMREQKSGTIVNVSSSIAFQVVPALGIYSATKWAMEAYTETLQMEVAAFGIRVMIVEPGATYTEFASEAGTAVRVPSSKPYQEGTVQQTADYVASDNYWATMTPSLAAAERIVQAIDGTGHMAGRQIKLRLPLGKDTGASLVTRAAAANELAGLEDVWGSV
ncbi:putative short chain oxidoreductase/dehydrogenase [Xylariaceae sp. FL1272]|nr:putative short chain oxidoreductase/dehydrogenase [Xylariaceae sp. FL1272]